jgi:hypothetical protein
MKTIGTMAALWALLSAAPLLAQPRPHRGDREERLAERRDKMFKMVDAYIAMHATDELGLTEEQAVKVLPLIRQLRLDRRRFAERRGDLTGALKDKLRSGTATEAEVVQFMKDIRALEREEPETIRKDREAIDAALSVVQQAKFRVLESEVERQIRDMVRRPRGPKPDRRGDD